MDRKSWRLSAFFVACRHSPASLQFHHSNQWRLGCTWGVSRQNRWRGWCWFWVFVLGIWCANVYCHHGDGAVKILCGPQSNVLVRERFSFRERGIEPAGIPPASLQFHHSNQWRLGCTWGVSRQNRWRGWCWFWVFVLGIWCANVYCHHGDGAVKILCGPQSDVLVRERFSLQASSGFSAKQKRPPQGVAAI